MANLVKLARYWIGTIPEEDFAPGPMPRDCLWIKGQLEVGSGGFRHWQVVLGLCRPYRRTGVSKLFAGHWEVTRSAAADEYVWKDETSVDGSRFE